MGYSLLLGGDFTMYETCKQMFNLNISKHSICSDSMTLI